MNETDLDVIRTPFDETVSLDWETLLTTHDAPVLSVYMPIEQTDAEADQNRIRLKNVRKKAAAALEAHGVEDVEARLMPLTDLQHEGPTFWREQGEGLACFLGEGFSRLYPLPFRPEVCVEVGSRCFVRPLVPLRENGDGFHLLALSRGDVRFFRGHRHGLHQIPLPEDVPTSLDAMLSVYDFEKSLQFHSADAAERGDGAPVYHGQGGSDRSAKDREYLEQYLRRIDDGIRTHLDGAQSPLVVVATEELRGHFDAVSNYPHRLDDAIDTHPDEQSAETLHAHAWRLMEPRVRATFDEAKGAYLHLAEVETERVASHLETIAPAACFARVERLFVPEDGTYPGTVDLENNTAERHGEAQPGDEDLVNLAIVETLKNGGTVHPCIAEELPARPVAAILRY